MKRLTNRYSRTTNSVCLQCGPWWYCYRLDGSFSDGVHVRDKSGKLVVDNGEYLVVSDLDDLERWVRKHGRKMLRRLNEGV